GWSFRGRRGRRAPRCARWGRSHSHLPAARWRRTMRLPVVLVVIILVEGDAVLLRDGGVLVIFRRRGTFGVSRPESEGFRPGLLQLARFFEAAMTTLLHGRAPTSSR